MNNHISHWIERSENDLVKRARQKAFELASAINGNPTVAQCLPVEKALLDTFMDGAVSWQPIFSGIKNALKMASGALSSPPSTDINEAVWAVRASLEDLSSPRTGGMDAMLATQLDFGQALVAIKSDVRVCRAEWNGKKMYLFLVPASSWTYAASSDHDGPKLPFIAMKTADNCIVPWLASQTDILATDWEISL